LVPLVPLTDGGAEGADDGAEGVLVGLPEGAAEGSPVGLPEGALDGEPDGEPEGEAPGFLVPGATLTGSKATHPSTVLVSRQMKVRLSVPLERCSGQDDQTRGEPL
jgi:hypothetical protein